MVRDFKGDLWYINMASNILSPGAVRDEVYAGQLEPVALNNALHFTSSYLCIIPDKTNHQASCSDD
jgi:hypothetical protein